MRDYSCFYIDGAWVEPAGGQWLDVFNPANGGIAGRVRLGSAADVERAVSAAQRASITFGRSRVDERLALLDRIIAAYQARSADLAAAITEEMGAPHWLATGAQVPIGLAHLQVAREVLSRFEFSEQRGGTVLVREPIGVCAFITPWNWPLNQIACKVAPAIATGCTMILKPSEVAPFSGHIFAEIMAEADCPAGVFNLVHGDGPGVGAELSAHAGVDMVSFTGSTRAGVEVARNAAASVKRVAQELGGKSPNVILPEANLEQAVGSGVAAMMMNSGQSCNAPARMLVPAERMQEAIAAARAAMQSQTVGAPESNARLGPVASRVQWDKIQTLIASGIAEGATLVAGGTGKPDGLATGYYVKPTVFADVTPAMRIATEEIFGPVLAIIGYRDVEDAIAIANDTPYGLAAYVQGPADAAAYVASRIRAGQILLNYAELDLTVPFGGMKQSGNGREWGDHGFADFLETKAIVGVAAAA